MDKTRRRKRFQQKKRNHDKWEKRVKQKKYFEGKDTLLYDEDLIEVGILANHGKMCSCSLCCNPRHSKYISGDQKLTIQERRYEK